MIAHSLSKNYRWKTVLKPVDWQLGKGTFCLIGPNNAGKSTMLKILSGALRPSHGDVTIGELKLSTDPDEYRQKIGYLPQHFSLKNDLTIYELMNTCAIFKGLKSRYDRKQEIKAKLDKLDLLTYQYRKLKTLPIGMLQRVGMAQAIINNPDILILDEPFKGLGPMERSILYRLLANYGTEHTVIFSCRNPVDMIGHCRSVMVLKSGELLFRGSPKEIASMSLSNYFPQKRLTPPHEFNYKKANDFSAAFINGYRKIVGGW